jgi:hypothetical protein
MHRWIARFLLLVAFAGNLAPLALAATAAPPHACCVRKAVHPCHNSLAAETGQLVIRASDCCNHNCGRAVIPVRWARAQPPVATSFAQDVEAYLRQLSPASPNTELCRFQSTRAPPHFSIA